MYKSGDNYIDLLRYQETEGRKKEFIEFRKEIECISKKLGGNIENVLEKLEGEIENTLQRLQSEIKNESITTERDVEIILERLEGETKDKLKNFQDKTIPAAIKGIIDRLEPKSSDKTIVSKTTASSSTSQVKSGGPSINTDGRAKIKKSFKIATEHLDKCFQDLHALPTTIL